MGDLEKIRRKVENAWASIRAAKSGLDSAQQLLDDALAELAAYRPAESDSKNKAR